MKLNCVYTLYMYMYKRASLDWCMRGRKGRGRACIFISDLTVHNLVYA